MQRQWVSRVQTDYTKDTDDPVMGKIKKAAAKFANGPKKLKAVPLDKVKEKFEKEPEDESDEEDNPKGVINEEFTLTAPRNKEALQKVKQIELEPFDHDKVSLDSMVIVVGKRRYGKTVWAEWLLSHMNEFFPRGGFVFTNTKHNYFWQKHFPENRVYGGVYPELIAQILADQKALYQSILLGAEVDISPFICIVLDDVITSKEIRFSPLIQELAWAGRHYFIFCIICTQDIKGLPPGFRGNADLIAVTYQTQERTMETLQADFADMFDNKYMFSNMIKKFTPDHGMLIIDQTTAKFDMNEIFYTDKADDPTTETVLKTMSFGPITVKGPVFKIGSDDFWASSQNSWVVQLFKAQNIPSSKREDWLKKIEEGKKDPRVQELLKEDFDIKRKKDPFNENENGKQSLDEAQPMKDTSVSKLSDTLGVELALTTDDAAPKNEKNLHDGARTFESLKNKIEVLRNKQFT